MRIRGLGLGFREGRLRLEGIERRLVATPPPPAPRHVTQDVQFRAEGRRRSGRAGGGGGAEKGMWAGAETLNPLNPIPQTLNPNSKPSKALQVGVSSGGRGDLP